MKKLLALLLAVAALFCFVACGSDEEDEEDISSYKKEDVIYSQFTAANGDVFYFDSIDSTSVKITGFKGSSTPHTVTIPATVKTSDDEKLGTKSVTRIDDCAFYAVSAMENVTIPSTVTEIGDFAFAKCVQLKSVTFSENLATLGEGAFLDCKALTSVTFAVTSAMTALPDYVFMGCTSLESLDVPAYIQTIGNDAFFNCPAGNKD